MGSSDSGGARRAGGRGRRRAPAVTTGKLRVHDPFELIRWLALSQADPRKALAELVQNSLDAGARTVRVVRLRERGVPCLRVWDDGEGVIPELDRVEALCYVATNIGHSRKRSLTPRERLDLMTQGQYGIGLLGFWSLGETLELRSSLPGQHAHRLVLHRDRPDYTIEPLRGRLPFDQRWTEIVVSEVHREAEPVLTCRRAAEYLAAELRGQLLAREVDLTVHDRVARGRGLKMVRVQPRRYLGEPLPGLGPLEVPDHPPLQVELYFTGEGGDSGEAGGIAVYAAGTLVAESFRDLMPLGLDHEPWTDARLTGFVDFPALSVAPGSRRGIIPDAASGLFVRALLGIEGSIAERLAQLEERRAEELDRALVRNLRRAFRGFYRQRPRYSLLPVHGEGEGGAAAGNGAAPPDGGGAEASGEAEPAEAAWPPVAELFPPGPPARVELVPARLLLECGERRSVRARVFDAADRLLREGVAVTWSLAPAAGRLEPGGSPRVVWVAAGDRPGSGVLWAVARGDGGKAVGEAQVDVVEERPGREGDEGIPEPELVDQPAAPWRSRLADDRWQVNSGHPEYRRIAGSPTLKLRYLALLFAKEVVLRSSQDPRLEIPLEQLVEVAAYADRQLHGKTERRDKNNKNKK